MRKILFILSLLMLTTLSVNAQPRNDQQRLSMALDYFQGGKYHEALTILARLDSVYRLNPRISAYTGLCYFYEFDYEHAADILDKALPQLTAFSPEERSIYYKADGDSHFVMKQYPEAEAAYDSLLSICPDKDKPEPYYRKGFIHIYNKEWLKALDSLQSSLFYYKKFLPSQTARIAQIRNMIAGCCEQINKTL